ncbi:MAG: EutP/PduV family microcompartment system protein [Flavonifractor plautii]
MKKIILMGRSECGKTTLTQALKGDVIHYHKTQYINHYDVVIDTPGEYAENASLAKALALYTYEADVVGLLLSSTEPYSLYPPCVTACCNRPVIGIVTQIDHPDGDPDRAQGWLELAGCHPIFRVSSYTGEGMADPQLSPGAGRHPALGFGTGGGASPGGSLEQIWEAARRGRRTPANNLGKNRSAPAAGETAVGALLL